MASAMALRTGLPLALLLVLVQVVSCQRIAEQKCAEYRRKTMKVTSIIPLTINPTPIMYSSFNCSKTVDLIVGGEAAKPNEFPHQALLGWRTSDDEYAFKCGGSLISERYVLTAAHCFKMKSPDIVRLGEHNLNDDYDNQVDLEIEATIRHPKHKFSLSYHDIALIKLAKNVIFSKVIRPACLWTGMKLNMSSAIASGYGSVETAGNSSEVLRKVMLDFLNTQECEEQFVSTRQFKNGVMGDHQLCIGSIRGGMDTCQGDSGGPIQVITDPKGCTYHVIGVTSTGSACGIGRSPSIYTRVASYIDWIENEVWNNGQPSETEDKVVWNK